MSSNRTLSCSEQIDAGVTGLGVLAVGFSTDAWEEEDTIPWPGAIA